VVSCSPPTRIFLFFLALEHAAQFESHDTGVRSIHSPPVFISIWRQEHRARASAGLFSIPSCRTERVALFLLHPYSGLSLDLFFLPFVNSIGQDSVVHSPVLATQQPEWIRSLKIFFWQPVLATVPASSPSARVKSVFRVR
jgi:hypothetical protein